MIPLLPFVAGLVAGAAAVSALRSERAKAALNETGSRLRSAAATAESGVRAAAQSGLALVRRTVAEKAAPEAKPARSAKAKKPARKPAAAKAAAPAKRAPRKPKAAQAEA